MDVSEPRDLDESAEALFADYLAQLERGEGADFDALCGQRPELAPELRGLMDDWRGLEGVLSRLGFSHDLDQRLRRSFGERATLDLELHARPRAEDAASAEMLERLVGRGSPHRYRVQGEIGRGGMGRVLDVWDEDLNRQLAMKILLAQTDPERGESADPRLLSRFLEEAQVTGQLDHPGIVTVHELGIDARGAVYFTMKVVRGRELGRVLEMARDEHEDWNRARALSTLLRVAEAMAYAHERGVVHRDLKPQNVMVGAFGEVYVMDWGLARVLDRPDVHVEALADEDSARPDDAPRITSPRRRDAARTPDSPLLTRDGQVVGTPAYMPPEQARGRLDAIGPRSDVYALGAILYELLTGIRPYADRPRPASPAAFCELVAKEPPTPIEAVAADAPPELAAICDRAMARDPGQRYASMSAFGDDLRSYLEGRVVAAYETGAWAELRKWVRRNRAVAASIAVALVALVVGIVTSTLARVEADRQRGLAVAEAETARSVARYLGDLFATANPREVGSEARVVDLLEIASRDIDTIFANAPEVRCYLHYAVGRTWQRLGELEEAEPHLARAAELASGLPADDEFGLEARFFQAFSHGDYDRAIQTGEHLIAVREKERGARHPDTLTAQFNLGHALLYIGRDEEAEELLRETYDDWVAADGADSIPALRCLTDLAGAQQNTGRSKEAEQTIRQVLDALERQLEPTHPEVLTAIATLTQIQKDQGRYGEAEELLVRLIEGKSEALGAGHPSTLDAKSDLANLLVILGRQDEAHKLFGELLRDAQVLEPSHPNRLIYENNFAEFLRQEGELARAEELHRSLLARREDRLGPEHLDTLTSMSNLALTLLALGAPVEAEELLRELLQRYAQRYPEGNWRLALTRHNLANLCSSTGRVEQALELQRSAVEMFVAVGDAQRTPAARQALVHYLVAAGELAEAEDEARLSLAGNEALYGPDGAPTREARFNLAYVLVERGSTDEARTILETLLESPTAPDWQLERVRQLLESIAR